MQDALNKPQTSGNKKNKKKKKNKNWFIILSI